MKLFNTKLYVEQPFQQYVLSKNKTLYLTWDSTEFLRPQTGSFDGRLHKTKSNLSFLDEKGGYRNVNALDIEQLHT